MTTKPLIEPIQTMLEDLGRQDACIQLQELSNRQLRQAITASKKPPAEFLAPLFVGSGIPNGTYDLDELDEVVAKSYLVLTYAQFERMLRGAIALYKKSHHPADKDWKTQNADGERYAPLEELYTNLPATKRKPLKACPEYELFEYYRVVRVANSHVKGTTLTRAEKDFKALAGRKDAAHFSNVYQLKAPNAPADVSFEDFLLFTRAIKYFARLVNEACA